MAAREPVWKFSVAPFPGPVYRLLNEVIDQLGLQRGPSGQRKALGTALLVLRDVIASGKLDAVQERLTEFKGLD